MWQQDTAILCAPWGIQLVSVRYKKLNEMGLWFDTTGLFWCWYGSMGQKYLCVCFWKNQSSLWNYEGWTLCCIQSAYWSRVQVIYGYVVNFCCVAPFVLTLITLSALSRYALKPNMWRVGLQGLKCEYAIMWACPEFQKKDIPSCHY